MIIRARILQGNGVIGFRDCSLMAIIAIRLHSRNFLISASARRLSVFKTVVDLGGFNLAADRLGIAQPSVGALDQIEREVQHPPKRGQNHEDERYQQPCSDNLHV